MRVKSTKKMGSRKGKGKGKGKADVLSTELKFVIDGIEFTPSPVLDTLFRFMAERHAIHQRRVAGLPEPWSDDPIFQNNSFTNIYRIYDRVSQYILQHVVNEGDPDLHECCFRVILFRFFCRISTWEHLQKRLGPLTWRDFDIDAYEDVLSEQYHSGVSLYGSAYQMPAPALGGATAYSNHLRLLKMMMDADMPGQLAQLEQLSDAYGRINLFPSMGNFLAFQLLLDLNMIPQLSFPENFAVCGPGARACLQKIFGDSIKGHEGPAVQFLQDHQHQLFARAGVPPARRPRLAPHMPPGVSVVDLEHALCECEKYSRAAHPTIRGRRTTVSRNAFHPSPAPLTCDLPCKWATRTRGVRGHERTAAKKAWCPPAQNPDDPDPVWEVSHVVREDKNVDGPVFLVRFVGWGPESDEWIDTAGLAEGAQGVLDEWFALKESVAARVAAVKRGIASIKKDRQRRPSARNSFK